MTEPLQEIVIALEKIGLTTVILPFALTFIILFSVLQRTKVLGQTEDKKPKKRLNLVVSLVVSLLVIAYSETVSTISRIAQYGVVLAIIALLCIIVFTFSGFPNIGKSRIMKITGIIAIIFFIFYVLGGFEFIKNNEIETKVVIPIALVLSFVLMAYFILKPKKEETAEKKSRRKLPNIEESETRRPREETSD
jgi:ABC-type multidrug transport system permease subunit